jgi:hypothetical protein
MLDEREFLLPYGIRAISRIHHERPYMLLNGMEYCVDYEPGESSKGLFGGNSKFVPCTGRIPSGPFRKMRVMRRDSSGSHQTGWAGVVALS